jgi:NTE family protein
MISTIISLLNYSKFGSYYVVLKKRIDKSIPRIYISITLFLLSTESMAKKGLYLAGGGARGAYQAGVLKAIAAILQVKALPFSMVSGVSVGSINAAILTQHADDFALGVKKLESLWSNIHCQDIFKTSNYQLGKSVVKNISHLIIKQRQTGHLLDTSPLHQFIHEHIDFIKMKENIVAGYLETVEVITNCYETQQTVSFYQHHTDFKDWFYPRHTSQYTVINIEHILASSALPLFFPTVNIAGLHYGDGSMGLVAPLRGAIRFNMEKIMILGTRRPRVPADAEAQRNGDIGFAQILGNMLNSLFIDNLDTDIEMVNRMNEIAQLLSLWKKRSSPWRPIQTLYLQPSIGLAAIAQEKYSAMPALLRFMLNLMGAKSHSGDLLSFLLFESDFTQVIFELGYKDTMATAEIIEDFFA